MKRGRHRRQVRKPCISIKLSAVVLSLLMAVTFMPISVMAEGSADTGGRTPAAEQQAQESGESEVSTGTVSGEVKDGQQNSSEDVVQSPEVKTPAETADQTADKKDGEEISGEGDGNSTAVARVGEKEYSDIDTAISEAEPGATIILLSNVEPKNTFYKPLTFSSEGEENSYSVTYDVYGWRYSGDLTFDHAKFFVNSDSNAKEADNQETARWFSMVFKDATLTLENGAEATYSFDSSAGTNCAIYTDERTDSSIIVSGGSSFAVYGKNTKGIPGQGVQLGNTANCKISVTGESNFLIDGCNRGYVNSPTVDVEDSRFTVQNCAANASNGGNFTAVNSTVNFLNNGGHGLSAGNTWIQNSKLTSTGNGYTGIHIGGDLTVRDNSKVISKENGWNSWDADRFAGLRIYGAGSLDATSSIDVENNYEVGMRIEEKNNTVDLSAGSVTIKDNGRPNIGSFRNEHYSWDKSSREGTFNNTTGGGIWNMGSLTLPESAVIYNNHAEKAGDDIYSTGTVTFGAVGSSWKLDAGRNGGGRADASGKVTGTDCSDVIDGWYDDTDAHRWEAHQDGKFHTQEVKAGKHVGELAVKAAHGISYSDVTPVIPDAPAATLSVRKVWKLDDGGTKPASINVVITRNGRAYTETLSDANNWTYTETVNTTDVITVTEGAIDGFAASMDISGFDFTITNDDVAPDEPVIPDKPSKPSEPSKPSKPTNGGTSNAAATKPVAISANGPRTGDESNVLFYGGLFTLAAAGIAVIIWRRRKSTK